ncbi:GntR family transcriptional regulator [Pararobbsia alpina]|uniref:GntR family transcriptional regulator n=1 Tax=Pararobbsia alpina TaxID=621374 RepID=UPI0039A5332E
MVTKTDLQAAQLVEAIKSDIIIGRLRPHQRLVEEEISAQFNVSRHVSRAALVHLDRMGLVTRRPNRGVIVRDFSIEQVEQIYEVRMILQREAAARVPMPARPDAIREIEAIHIEYCRELDAGNLLQVNVLNDAFHRRIWATCPNQYLAETIEKLWVETTGIRWYGVGDPQLLSHSREHHATMIEQLKNGDREGFVALAVDHIMPPLEAFRRAHRMSSTFSA